MRLSFVTAAAFAALFVTAASPLTPPRGSGSRKGALRTERRRKARQRGSLGGASALLRSEADDPSRPAASRKKAASALEALEKRMPHLSLEVPASFKGTIAIDGAPLEVARWPAPLALDPGEHVVTTRVGVATPVRYPITLRERERHVLALVDDAPSATPATASPSGEKDARARSDASPWRTVGFVGLGAGIVALGAGGVLAVMASNDKSALEARCPNNVCPEAVRADFDSGRSKANLATFALAGGAVLTAASVALVVFGPQKKEDGRLELRAGVGSVSLKGSFQ
ncbi:MAG: hypothetical protein U0235_27100 [Polyangiaceae bacterium]